MTRIYQHWIGQMVVEAGKLPAATHRVEAWFPAPKPAGAVLIGHDVYPTPTRLFPKVIRLSGKVGPLKLHLNVNLTFQGTVEHWQAPLAVDRGPPPDPAARRSSVSGSHGPIALLATPSARP